MTGKRQMTAATNNCPFCHNPLGNNEAQTRCPECERGYHPACWRANDNHCSVLGCSGSGAGLRVAAPEVAAEIVMLKAKETTMTELVECPHCGGYTVCNVEGNGSCLRCLTQNNVTNLERVVICSVCNGSGEVELPVERADCRHCEGSTLCNHGILDDASCQSCINFGTQGKPIRDRSGKTVMVSFAEATMCSVCKGQGAVAAPRRDRNRSRNNW